VERNQKAIAKFATQKAIAKTQINGSDIFSQLPAAAAAGVVVT